MSKAKKYLSVLVRSIYRRQRMYFQRALVVCVLLCCSSASGDQWSSLAHKAQPVYVSEADVDVTINQFFGSDDECECVSLNQCKESRTDFENGASFTYISIDGTCKDSMEVCCQKGDILPVGKTAVIQTPPHQRLTSTCGRRNFQGVSSLRTTKGTDQEAHFGEFPWVVAITQKLVTSGKTQHTLQCAGSLINLEVVLTAAHCVNGKSDLQVRAGEWDAHRASEPLPTQTRSIRQVIIHEKFDKESLLNDVALLFLESAVQPAPNVAPICLPEQGENMNRRQCVANGWGKDIFEQGGKYSVILKKVELSVVESQRCEKALQKTRLGNKFRLHSSFICAGGKNGQDTCTGDGGGPLVCPSVENPAIYVQAGIVAWGIGCGTDAPGVYVNVAQFRDWIDKKMTMVP